MGMIMVDQSKTAEYRVRFAGDTADWDKLPVVETLFVKDTADANHMATLVADSKSTEACKVVAVRWNFQGINTGHFIMTHQPNVRPTTIHDLMSKQASEAYAKYHANYNNALYLAAVGDDWEAGQRWGDTALALCGHPACVVDHSFEGNAAAIEFLAKFV